LSASNLDVYDLHFHQAVAELGKKPEKAADGRVFPITVLSSLPPALLLHRQAVKMHHPNSPLADTHGTDQNQKSPQPKTFQNHL